MNAPASGAYSQGLVVLQGLCRTRTACTRSVPMLWWARSPGLATGSWCSESFEYEYARWADGARE